MRIDWSQIVNFDTPKRTEDWISTLHQIGIEVVRMNKGVNIFNHQRIQAARKRQRQARKAQRRK